MTDIQEKLFSLKDDKYKKFQAMLIPNVPIETIIGVRIPVLRKFAKSIISASASNSFIDDLPHKFYDENNLHAFIIEETKDFYKCVEQVNAFLPYVDNWATCDSLSPKIFKKNKNALFEEILLWLSSEHTYTVRFAIKNLITHFSREDFKLEHIYLVKNLKSNDYYVNMAVAWYLATELSVNFEQTLPIFKQLDIEPFVYNKAIQKAVESLRTSDEQKNILRALLVK